MQSCDIKGKYINLIIVWIVNMWIFRNNILKYKQEVFRTTKYNLTINLLLV